jgi:oligoendopeptidase F
MMNSVKEPKYATQPKGWDLGELLPEPSEEVIAERLANVEASVTQLEKQREKLDPEMDPALVVQIIQQVEDLVEQVYVLGAYGSLWFAAETQSSAALTYRNRMMQALTQVQNRTLFFDLWWKSLNDDEAAALLPSEEEYPDYRHHLIDMRRTKPYTKDEQIEQVINIKDANGIDAVVTLYDMLTSRLEFTIEVEGKEQTLTRDALMSHVHSPNADLRAAAYQELYRVYKDEANILSQMYANRVRDWYTEQVELRGYTSPISVRNVANDIPDEAVDTLLDVCSNNVDVFQRYFRLKAGWLGIDKLRRYDIYAPLAESDREIEYADAVAMVLETFADFDPLIAEQAERVFAQDHIDAEVRKGKRGGAFCATVLPSQTPWVLMNYTGKVRDVATLAHELGHAIHSMMAADHSVLTQHAALPLAETASVFAEMLLTDRLLEEEQNPLVKREILAAAVDDMYATVMRQAYFVAFERTAHDAILANKSSDELNELYWQNLEEQFGDSVELGEEFQFEWVSIPHIYHTPFYCYAYSFGQLLVLALYRRFQQEGEAFKPGYLRLLAHGGSAPPADILEEAGIDISDPAFWQGGFDVISDMIDQLEAIEL